MLCTRELSEEESLRNYVVNTKIREEKGGSTPDTRADILLQPMGRTMLKNITTLQPVGDLMLQKMNML